MERNISLITNYYPPETGAASNRIALMAENFAKAGYKTQVICPLPNYPTGKIFDSYKGKSGQSEVINGVTVTRLWVFATNSPNKWKRLFSMTSFSMSLGVYAIKNKLPSLVFVQFSPLLIGFFSILYLRSSKRKLLLNISDLWPLAGKELGKLKEGLVYNYLEKLERFSYRNASVVLGQSEEIIQHVHDLYPEKETFLFRNFPDFTPQQPVSSSLVNKKMVYAGLLGVAQGIHELCEAIDLPEHWEFHIYGDGAQRAAIENFLKSTKKAIFFHGSLSRKELHEALQTFDLTIIPLVQRIYGSVPSKIFEYGRLGLPMLYFGGGEGETLVEINKLGWVAPSGDYQQLNTQLLHISKDTNWPSKSEIQAQSIKAFDAALQFEDLLKVLD